MLFILSLNGIRDLEHLGVESTADHDGMIRAVEPCMIDANAI